ncbi:hypothetical protein E3983_08145 [Legionella israelensis]|uniref:Ankyrin repeat domain-containing protein n=1 Tax=Legionella israelensis TaxID=454 RepID=A0AAX1EH10_9GAMM|nr:ankyrin repeat domain-containing protein [Legionella israelensis]QBR84334.1 hypothetical protein E3983_08145 [Legionella israelensis]
MPNKSTPQSLFKDDNQANNPLHDAILDCDVEAFQSLLRTTDAETLQFWLKEKSFGNTPMLLATKTCAVDIVKMISVLSSEGFDIGVEEEDSSYLRPLHWAALFKSKEMIESLIESGAHPKNGYRINWDKHLIAADLLRIPSEYYANAFENVIALERIKEKDQEFLEASQLNYGKYKINFSDAFFHWDRICINLGLIDKNQFFNRDVRQSAKYFMENTIDARELFIEYLEGQQQELESIDDVLGGTTISSKQNLSVYMNMIAQIELDDAPAYLQDQTDFKEKLLSIGADCCRQDNFIKVCEELNDVTQDYRNERDNNIKSLKKSGKKVLVSFQKLAHEGKLDTPDKITQATRSIQGTTNVVCNPTVDNIRRHAQNTSAMIGKHRNWGKMACSAMLAVLGLGMIGTAITLGLLSSGFSTPLSIAGIKIGAALVAKAAIGVSIAGTGLLAEGGFFANRGRKGDVAVEMEDFADKADKVERNLQFI